MPLDEKKAILRGLSATAQQVRDEAASPVAAARLEASRRAADTRYRLLSAPLVALPLLLSLMAAAWEQYRFYHAGLHWGSHAGIQRFLREGMLLIAAGLVMCGGTFALLWLFRDVAQKTVRRFAIVAGILAALLPIIGVCCFGASYRLGRSIAYSQFDTGESDYAELVAAARALRPLHIATSTYGVTSFGEDDPQWASLPQTIQKIKGARIFILENNKGFALELDNTGHYSEGLLVPTNMTPLSAERIADSKILALVSRDPPVFRFTDFPGGGERLNEILNPSTLVPPPGIIP